ncbi:MAG: hypothetical protein U1F35_03755 [Steroidobacteraceae bacterium]
MPRPLLQLGVGDLEALFSKSKTDVKVLKQLENELQHRQMPRAVALLAEVQAAMYGATPAAPAVTPTQPAPAPHQPGLWEPPPATAPAPVAAPVAPPRQATPAKAPAPPAAAKVPQPAAPVMPLEDAYRLLKATPGSTWESIEQTRRQLVQQSHPARLKSMSPERRTQVLAEAKRVNSAHSTLSQARCGGR